MRPDAACRLFWKTHDSVLAAVSGGADSVALLCALSATAEGKKVAAVHLNHSLRGAESDRDEAFVKALCKELSVPLYGYRADVPALAAKNGQSVETAARHARYAVFEKALQKSGCAVVATAHTADDNAETVLMHLLRGSGLTGLCGIPASRGAVRRPFLAVTRREIEAYLRELGQDFAEDSTNAADDCRRNRIRHRVMPHLTAENPRFAESVAKTVSFLQADEHYLREQAKDLAARAADGKGRYLLAALREAPQPLVMRLLLAEEMSSEMAQEVYKMLMQGKTGDCRQLYGDRRARIGYRFLTLEKTAPPPESSFALRPGETPFCGGTLCLEEGKIHGKFTSSLVACDKIKGKLYVRTRRQGDILSTPAGRKSLKKLFIDRKIEREERDRMPLVCDDEGIVWTPLYGAVTRVKPDTKTEKIYKITYMGNENDA